MVVTEQYVVLDDKYPKARLHILVIARDPALLGPADLRPEHLPLLAAMKVCLLRYTLNALLNHMQAARDGGMLPAHGPSGDMHEVL